MIINSSGTGGQGGLKIIAEGDGTFNTGVTFQSNPEFVHFYTRYQGIEENWLIRNNYSAASSDEAIIVSVVGNRLLVHGPSGSTYHYVALG